MNYDLTQHLEYCEDPERYEKIENIDKKYIFTSTIAYEFARRNENVNNILCLLEDLNFFYEKKIKDDLGLLKELASNLPKLDMFGDKYLKLKNKMEKIILSFLKAVKETIIHWLNVFDRKEFIIIFKYIKIENIEREIKGIFEVLADELYYKYYVIYQIPAGYNTELKEIFCNSNKKTDKEIESWVKNIETKIETNGDFYSNEIYSPKKYIERDATLSEMVNSLSTEDRSKIEIPNSNDSFILTQIKKGNKKEYFINNIYPKNDCPMRDFADIKIAINLKLPEDEILSYIKEIKKEYNRNNSIIKTNMELLKDELEIKEDEFKNNRRAKGREEKLSKDKRHNWADMFFIYDYYTQQRFFNEKSFEKIKEELIIIFSKKYGVQKIKYNKDGILEVIGNMTWDEYFKNYHSDENEKEITFTDVGDVRAVISEKSIREKYKIMRDYIEGDNPKYKILLNC